MDDGRPNSPPCAGGLAIEEIRDGPALAGLAAAWRELFARAPGASPFLSPDWLLPWQRRFARSDLWCLALRCEQRLVGLAPFYLWRDPADGACQVTLLGNGRSDRLGLLAAPGWEGRVAAAVLAHLAQAPGWTRCDFRDLPEGASLLQAATPAGLRSLVSAEAPCPLLRLPEPGRDILGGLPKGRRAELRRRTRRLLELGPLDFRLADRASLEGDLEALLGLHARRWAGQGQAGVFADPEVAQFQREVTPALLAGGLLRLHVLSLDGRIIAAHFGLLRGTRAYSYIPGFDPAFARFAPGWLLMAHCLDRARAEGAVWMDFLRGGEPYKYEWGARDQPQFRRRLFR